MNTVSIRDVATRAGVSVGTVSNVLNKPELVSAGTAQRVQEAIAALGFVRNDAARLLRAGRSKAIGLVVLDAANPYFMSLARGAETRAAERGLSVLLGNSDNDAQRERAYLDLFEEQRVLGVLITPADTRMRRLEEFRDRGHHAVLVDRAPGTTPFASVAVDDVGGGELACKHLLGLGRRRLAFVGGPVTVPQVRDRIVGARDAVSREPSATLTTIETSALTVIEGRRVGRALGELPSADRPDAVFCANDLLAVGVMQALVLGSNVRIPDDVALIGYDDIDFAQSTVVPLSSVRQPSTLIGATAVDHLLALTAGEGERHTAYRPDLVARASTDPQAA